MNLERLRKVDKFVSVLHRNKLMPKGLYKKWSKKITKIISAKHTKGMTDEDLTKCTDLFEAIHKQKPSYEKVSKSIDEMNENTSEKVLENLTMRYFVLSLILENCIKHNGISKDDYHSNFTPLLPKRSYGAMMIPFLLSV